MTTIPTQADPQTPGKPRGGKTGELLARGKYYLALYLLIAPTLIGMLLFNYYPKFEAITMSLYDWDGQQNQDFIGFKNFLDLFSGRDPLFFPTFQLVLILLVANAIKMWPSIFTAIALHRLKSEKWQYIYRVLFVVPMVIPGLVWLLIWKNFFDPNVGILNKLLQATGLMRILNWLDRLMPVLASALEGVVGAVINPVFGNLWAMLLFGAMCLSMSFGLRGALKAWVWWTILLLVGAFLFPGSRQSFLAVAGDMRGLWTILLVTIPFVLVVAAGGMLEKWQGSRGRDVMKWVGLAIMVAAGLLILLTKIWYKQIGQFDGGAPAWLSNSKLVIPSLIIWGFPWIGTVGVLIYLAGLQAISTDVYEAAELDGVSSIGKIFRIELPLMMTQVRINLIFMTIGTLTDYGLILLLLGADGGPSNVGMVPGLYMYKKAFIEARFGYACALGMVMFALILLITVIYQRYVKVEK